MNQIVPITAMPVFDPGSSRITITLPEGCTVAEIVDRALADKGSLLRSRTRVSLVAPDGRMVALEQRNWHLIRPHAGVHVVIRVLPVGGLRNILRSILTVVVSIAAIALAAIFAPALAGFLGISQGFAQGLITLGVTAVGRLLINALVPAQTPGGDNEVDRTFLIDGFRNQARIDAPVPVVMGRVRYAPPYAATPYTEIVGDEQYARAAFLVGYGQIDLSSIKIGETPIGEFDEVQMEVRTGLQDDADLSLYPKQVIEAQLGVDLTRDKPRDDNGDIVDGPAIEKPEVRFTARDAADAGVIIGFPQGLIEYEDDGDERTLTVSIKIEHRAVGDADWTLITTLDVSAKKAEPFFRFYQWPLNPRGRYEVRLTRMTDEREESRQLDRSVWIALQSFRPEYPIQFDQPLALLALRIKATEQLNGPLDAVNILCQSICSDWDAASGTWITRATSNPASLFRQVLQGPANAMPVADADIDLDMLAEWHEFCVAKGLEYNRVHDFEGSLFDALKDIAGAGRATPHHDGISWSVVIDRPKSIVVDHVTERNAREFKFARAYFSAPDGFRVTFQDETADYALNERVIPWPGHTGDILLTEELRLPGKTDPNEIWIETRRRMYELLHRPDRFTALQDGSARVATRGDLVRISHSVLDTVHASARVRSVINSAIELDSLVELEAGVEYGIRFMVLAQDGSGTSRLVSVGTGDGPTGVLTLNDPSEMPEVGDIIMFGPLGTETEEAIVAGVEAAEDFSSNMMFVAAAPIIDTLTDAETPPVWDGRVGDEIGSDTTPPAEPSVFSVETNTDNDGLVMLLTPGSGSAALIATYTVEHRPNGTSGWTTVTASAGGSGLELTGYQAGDLVDYRAFATSSSGIEGPTTSIRTVTIASPAPLPIAPPSASVTGGRGTATISVVTPVSDFSEIRVYRGPTNDFADAVQVGAFTPPAATTVTYVDGDATRPDIIQNGAFASDTVWTKGAGWTITGNAANHTPGVASDLTQNATLTDAKTYRYRIEVSGRSAGELTLALQGTSTLTSAPITLDGVYFGSLIAVTGQDQIALQASDAFDGSVQSLIMFEASTASVAQGTFHYFAVAANSEGSQGPETYAGAATII